MVTIERWRPRELLMRRTVGGLWTSFGPAVVDGDATVLRMVHAIVQSGLELQQAGL